MTERLEFRYSPGGQTALLVTSGALVAGSWFVAATTSDVVYRIVGWFGAAFFTLCGLIALRRLLAGGVPFVFDRSGISFPGGNFGLVPWTDMKEYAVVSVRGNYFLAIAFHDPERVLSRMSPLKRRWARINHRLGWGHWALSFTGLTPGMDEAVSFIREHSLLRHAG